MKNASDVVPETKGGPSAQMLRWDPGPAQVLGSTYAEPEDVPTVSVAQEERQTATPGERASAEDKVGNARVVYTRVTVSVCSVSAEDKEAEDKEENEGSARAVSECSPKKTLILRQRILARDAAREIARVADGSDPFSAPRNPRQIRSVGRTFRRRRLAQSAGAPLAVARGI